jgi:hypothetical protein
MKRLAGIILVLAAGCSTSVTTPDNEPETSKTKRQVEPVDKTLDLEKSAPEDVTETAVDALTEPAEPSYRNIIKGIIGSHRKQMQTCYNRRLAEMPYLAGRLKIRWGVTEEGNVVGVTKQEDLINDSELFDCVADVIRTMKFPPPKSGGIVMVNYPLNFTKGEIVCASNEKKVIEGAEFNGTVFVHASDGCTVTIRSSVIKSKETAFIVRGSAKVTLEYVTVSAPRAIHSDGDTQVRILKSNISGSVDLRGNTFFETTASVFDMKISTQDNASVIDGGQNTFSESVVD